jgi:trans-aconitate 2-methyltransferase
VSTARIMTAKDTWAPVQYERFRRERLAPGLDLLALVEPRPGMRIVDLGSGTGELTRLLHERMAARETLGIERSPQMLEASRARRAPGLRFTAGDIAEFVEHERFDLVFSNAALQWVPDHDELLPRLAHALAPGGQLAFQVPANAEHLAHTVAAELAEEEPFRSALGGNGARPLSTLAPETYALMLAGLGARRQHVRLQVYLHTLTEPGELVEWTRGTLLTYFRSHLDDRPYDAFEARYRERLLARLPPGRPYHFAFKRILAWAAW